MIGKLGGSCKSSSSGTGFWFWSGNILDQEKLVPNKINFQICKQTAVNFLKIKD